MRARLPWSPAPSDEHPLIEPLEADHARHLRLSWLSRFNTSTLEMHLAQYPHHSLWVPSTGEYALVTPWRSRSDIAQVVEVTARRGKVALVRSMTDLMRERGYKMLLLSDDVWNDETRHYVQLGFSQLERIVFFQRDLRRLDLAPLADGLPHLDFTKASASDLDILMRLDHASFPWLWWNSPVEFKGYLQLSDVQVYIALLEEKPVGYASFTMYKGWAHLDRLAVIEEEQGKGFGAAQLHHILGIMQGLSADSVNLSTQEDNVRSHRLYKSFGFRRTTEKMGFYGREL
ncbi:MAG: GNAT family N-acetyltransferase [Chloroflexia bacterium]